MSPFLHGTLFWGGLGLVSVPVIIHLINRRRFRQLEWAAMEFLLEAMRRNRRRIRLEHLILLLLRMALVLLVVAALARPHLSQSSFGWLSGPFLSEEKVFLIDDSLSMAHVDSGRTSFERGIDSLLAALDRVASEGGRDPVTILRGSRHEVPLFNAIHVEPAGLDRLEDQLRGEAFRPTAVRLSLAAALEDLAASARPERGRTISLITDLARGDWTDGEGRPLDAVRRALERLVGPADSQTRLLVLDVGARARDNVAVIDLSLTAPNAITGVPVDLRVEIANHGSTTVRGAGIRLRTADSAVPGPRLDAIEPGGTASLEIPFVFRESGSRWVEVELEGVSDGLGEDDRRRLVVQVLDAVECLIVDGEPSGTPGEGESDFLVQALRPAGEVASGFQPTVAVEANLPAEPLDRLGVIILANVADVPGEFAFRLGDYVREGGGLIIFPGDQVDGNLYERRLGPGTPESAGADLLPASIGEVAGDSTRPVHFTASAEHPAFGLLRGGGDELLRIVDVRQFRRLTPHPAARVVSRLTDAGSSPFLVERQVGRGRVALFAVPADLEWTNWPRSPSFLPVVLELTNALARPQGASWNRLAGARVEIAVDLARHQRQAKLRDPGYPTTPEARLIAAPLTPPAGSPGAGSINTPGASTGDPSQEKGEGLEPPEAAGDLFRFVIDDTRRGGIYTLTRQTVSGEEEALRLAVNPHPAESDLARLADGELESLYEGLPITVVRDVGSFSDTGRGHFEIADALLALFLLLLLVEGTLAWWFAHHRPSREERGDQISAGSQAGLAVRDAQGARGGGRP